MIKPRKLNPGDTIAIISPSSPTKDPTAVPRGKEYLESLGYKVVLGKHVDEWRANYVAASEEARAEDLNEMFARKDVDMILCARGGYGALQFIDKIDFDNIKANPKIFCGYSDITSLHLAIGKFAGLVTIHGEVLTAINPGISGYTKDHWLRCLTTTEDHRAITLADPNKYLTTIAPGKAEGEVIGGNLCLIASSCGTFYQPDFKDKILFFEEGSPYSLYGYAIPEGKQTRKAVVDVFNFFYTTLVMEDKELYYPEQVFAAQVNNVANYPTDIKYADMHDNTTAEKARLLDNWEY